MISTDKAALLWMYCRQIAPFETSTFSKNVGALIARAKRVPYKRATRGPKRASDYSFERVQRVMHDPVPTPMRFRFAPKRPSAIKMRIRC